jgi:hypothetical protein
VLRRERGAICSEGAARRRDGAFFKEQAVAITPDARDVERHQKLCGADGVERPLQMIAEIDELRDAGRGGIGKDGFERQAVAVDV